MERVVLAIVLLFLIRKIIEIKLFLIQLDVIV